MYLKHLGATNCYHASDAGTEFSWLDVDIDVSLTKCFSQFITKEQFILSWQSSPKSSQFAPLSKEQETLVKVGINSLL